MAGGVHAVVRIGIPNDPVLDRIWILKHARNHSGLFLHLDKRNSKGYILRYKHTLTVHATSLYFYSKMRYAVKL